MKFFDIVIFAIVLSIDATAVAITDGVCYRRFRNHRLLLAASLFGLFQGIMPLLGYYLYAFFAEQSAWFVSSGRWISFILLLFIGGKMIYEAVRSMLKGESCKIKEDISLKTLLVQALATSLDALAIGVSIYVAHDGTAIGWAALIIALVTLAFSYVGGLVGKAIGPFVHRIAPLIGGLTLIAIGVSILLG